jgi:hypothetical protein
MYIYIYIYISKFFNKKKSQINIAQIYLNYEIMEFFHVHYIT